MHQNRSRRDTSQPPNVKIVAFILLALLCAVPAFIGWSSDSPSPFIRTLLFKGGSNIPYEGSLSSLAKADSYNNWSTRSTYWWENESRDPNWLGRRQLHDELKTGILWFDKNLEDYFISKLETNQLPANCSDNFWIAHRTPDVGLLATVHTFIPVLLMGLMKGEGFTVLPVALTNAKSNLTTFTGCGEKIDKHVGCFFNVTSCRREEHQVRNEQITHKGFSFPGASWDTLLKTQKVSEGGMTILRDNLYRKPNFKDPWRAPKSRLWKELVEHGRAGVYRGPEGAMKNLRSGQIDFALMSMVSAWMMERTSENVKRIADRIMSKYADPTGVPSWKPPVIAMHIRQTDKKMEDPYFREHGKYRSVSDYIGAMKKMEVEHAFEWPTIFLISDSGTAIDSFARVLNGVLKSNAPDSLNGRKGKRFIMYDWSWDDKLIERTGGHLNIPSNMKFTSQEHFLATLYIIHKLADYALVSYSSNVGRFVGELIGARHRLAMELPQGPNALSWDTSIIF